jgi:histidyl-tRNA synthetase
MGYANDKQIPYVVLVGEDEMQSGELSLKDMVSGQQEKVSVERLIEVLQ